MQLEMLTTGSGRFRVAIFNKICAEDLGDDYGINNPRFIYRTRVFLPKLRRLLCDEAGLELDSHRIAKGSL